jgi:hypothetical protein
MAKIDALSLVLGVLLSIVVTGFYDSVFYFFQLPEKMTEFNSSFWATIITFIIFASYTLFFFFLFKKEDKAPTSAVSTASNGNNKPKFDKDIELHKIQIIVDDFRMWINVGSSILTGALIAYVVLILTSYYNKQLDIIFGLLSLIAIGVVLGGCIIWLYRRNEKFLLLVDDWIKKIGKGEQLPSITEMKKHIKARSNSPTT